MDSPEWKQHETTYTCGPATREARVPIGLLTRNFGRPTDSRSDRLRHSTSLTHVLAHVLTELLTRLRMPPFRGHTSPPRRSRTRSRSCRHTTARPRPSIAAHAGRSRSVSRDGSVPRTRQVPDRWKHQRTPDDERRARTRPVLNVRRTTADRRCRRGDQTVDGLSPVRIWVETAVASSFAMAPVDARTRQKPSGIVDTCVSRPRQTPT